MAPLSGVYRRPASLPRVRESSSGALALGFLAIGKARRMHVVLHMHTLGAVVAFEMDHAHNRAAMPRSSSPTALA
jgi:hypothetical protein